MTICYTNSFSISIQSSQGVTCATKLHKTVGGVVTFLCFEPVGVYTTKSVIRDQRDTRLTVTFPAAERRRSSTSFRLYCLVTEAHARKRLSQCHTRPHSGWESNLSITILTPVGGMAQWLGRLSLTGELSLICAWSVADMWPLCG